MVLIIMSFMVSAFLAGYISGRKTGLKEGKELGMLYAPFEIRKTSLENGRCIICSSTINCDKSASMIE